MTEFARDGHSLPELANKTVWRVTLTAEGDGPPAVVRLRRLLKAALRTYGLRCLAVVPPDDLARQSESAGDPRGPPDAPLPDDCFTRTRGID
jgi:hypothetical protein